MNIYEFVHLVNHGFSLYVVFIICLIAHNTNTLEQNDGQSVNGQSVNRQSHPYTQSHNNRRHHNHHHNRQYHKIRRNYSYKVHAKSDPMNQGDFQSSRRSSDIPKYSRKLVPPLSPSSILFDEPAKGWRRRNATSKLPNIIFILTDDQDIELGKSSIILFSDSLNGLHLRDLERCDI